MAVVEAIFNIFGVIIIWIRENLLIIQISSLFISSVLLVLIIFFIVKTNMLSEEIEHFISVLGSKDLSRRRSLKAWKQIQKRLKTGQANQLKLAVLEADRILNEILKMAGWPGKNLDERLEQAGPVELSNLEEIRQAHKLRNRIANEPNFIITPNEAGLIVEIYKKVFQELNLIE